MLTDIENRKSQKSNFFVSVSNSWLELRDAKITLGDLDIVELERMTEEVRELLDEG